MNELIDVIVTPERRTKHFIATIHIDTYIPYRYRTICISHVYAE